MKMMLIMMSKILKFSDEFEETINKTKNQDENLISLIIHPYLYGISYLIAAKLNI